MNDTPSFLDEFLSGKAFKAQRRELCPKCARIATGCSVEGVKESVAYWRCNTCRIKWHAAGQDRPYNRAAVERHWEGN